MIIKTYLQYITEDKKYNEIKDKFFEFIDKNSDNVECILDFVADDIDNEFPDFEFFLDDNFKFKISSVSESIIRISNYTGTHPTSQEFDLSNKFQYMKDIKSKIIDYMFIIIIKNDIRDLIEFLESHYKPIYIKELQDKIKESYEYQKRLIEEGYISDMKDLKLNPKIVEEYPEMNDIKKQNDWS